MTTIKAKPASRGDRVAALFITLAIAGTPSVIALLAVVPLFLNPTLEGLGMLIPIGLGLMALELAVLIWALYLILGKATTIGGKFRKIVFVDSATGQRAPGKLFLKILIINGPATVVFNLEKLLSDSYEVSPVWLFLYALLLIVPLAQWLTFRNGQHFADRIVGIVGVYVDSLRPGDDNEADEAPKPAPRVKPVTMPEQKPTADESHGAVAQSGQGPGMVSPQPAQPVTGTPQATQEPTGQRSSFGTPQPPSSFQFGVESSLTPSSQSQSNNSHQTPFASSDPTPQSGEQRSNSAASGVSGFVSSSPFAPQGQGPIPKMKPEDSGFAGASPTPPAPYQPEDSPNHLPDASGMVDDKTEIDPDLLGDTVLVSLDDGTQLVIDGPVIFGRNPTPPESHPSARKEMLVDESKRLSKTHLLLVPADGHLEVIDTDSRNGVFVEVNGSKMRIPPRAATPVVPGTTIHLGGRTIRV